MQLRNHDITLEAAWPELFIDHKGQYWDVPESISLDLSSLVSESGLRYRFGLHKNSGHPQALNANNVEAPLALLPGLCAKAAFSYEKGQDFWRQKEKEEDVMVKTDRGLFWRPSYDVRLNEPHSAISGIIGNFLLKYVSFSSSIFFSNSFINSLFSSLKNFSQIVDKYYKLFFFFFCFLLFVSVFYK